MAFEKRYAAIAARLFVSDGQANGNIELPTTSSFKVKQKVVVTASGEPNQELEVKAVFSDTILKVGPISGNIRQGFNLSAYTVVKNAAILADEQPRAGITGDEIRRAVYDEEPTMAYRNVMVDEFGRYWDKENRFPVDIGAEINVENLNLEVNTDAFDPENPDSNLAVGTEDGTKNGTKHVVRIGEDLNLRVKDEDALKELKEIKDVLLEPLKIEKPIVIAGTDDGDPNSTPFVFVNNIKNQILASQDREQEIIYADFGTKNQRVIEIIYTSPTFPSVQAIKTLSYTLIGNRYRRDTITWEIE